MPNETFLRAALRLAAERGDAAMVAKLLADGADPNAGASSSSSSVSPLWIAAESGGGGLSMGPFNVQGPASGRYAAVVRALLESEADVNWQHPHHASTALHAAVENRNEAAARLLLQHPRVNVNAAMHGAADRSLAGRTPLHEAAQAAEYGNTTVCRMLLEAGADPTIRAAVGTAAEWAELHHNQEAAEMIRLAEDLPLHRARQRLAFAIGCSLSAAPPGAEAAAAAVASAAHNHCMAYDLLAMTMHCDALRGRLPTIELALRARAEEDEHHQQQHSPAAAAVSNRSLLLGGLVGAAVSAALARSSLLTWI